MRSEKGWFIWRASAALAVLALVVFPLVLPWLELFSSSTSWMVWAEADRLGRLALNTFVIATGSSLLAVTLGMVTALLLVRTTLACRWLWCWLLGIGLFIPLPMLMSGWYMVGQSLYPTMPALWPNSAKLIGIIILHGLLGLPWVVLVISLGLLWIEPELEEEMLLTGSFPRVFRRIILPCCWPFLGMSVWLVSWITWHEITVTDFFAIRTLAEEVYLQLNSGGSDEVARSLAAIFPWCLLAILLTVWVLCWWKRRCPSNWPGSIRQRRFQLGKWQPLAQLWMVMVTSLLLILPCLGLISRAGQSTVADQERTWSFSQVLNQMTNAISTQNHIIQQSLVMSAITGIVISLTALILIWLARGSSRTGTWLWWLVSILWSLPGPIIGLSLLAAIQVLIQLPGGHVWSSLLYSEATYLPNIWASWLRYLPIAWLALWPVMQTMPRAWEEEAWLEGASPWRRFVTLLVPHLWKPALLVALGISLLALGEISASKLVTTPGVLPLSHHLFQQLHAGADAEVAALSLVLLVPAIVVTMAVVLCIFLYRWSIRERQ